MSLARSYGWTAKSNSSHGGTTLLCPSGVHKVRVYSTGKGSEAAARSSLQKVKKCAHRDIQNEMSLVFQHVDSADRFVQLAERTLENQESTVRLETLMDQVELAGTELQEAENLFEKLAQEDAVESRDSNVPLPDLVDNAKSEMRAGRQILKELPSRHESVQVARQKLDDLHQRRDEIIARIPDD